MHSTHSFGREIRGNHVFVAEGRWVLIQSEVDMTVVTIGRSGPHLIFVLTKETLMRSARTAIGMVRAVLLITALALLPGLAWKL